MILMLLMRSIAGVGSGYSAGTLVLLIHTHTYADSKSYLGSQVGGDKAEPLHLLLAFSLAVCFSQTRALVALRTWWSLHFVEACVAVEGAGDDMARCHSTSDTGRATVRDRRSKTTAAIFTKVTPPR